MPEPEPIFVTKPDDLARLIACAQQAGYPGTAHLLRAARASRISLAVPQRHARPNLKALDRTHRPAVVVLGDDDGASTGPDGWACARRVLWWARAVMVHAAGGEPWHYELAVQMAEQSGRALLIETSSAQAPAWSAALAAMPHRIPGVLVTPTAGPHPLPLRREEMQ